MTETAANRPAALALVNALAGSAAAARAALDEAGCFDVREIDPKELRDQVQDALHGGTTRVVVAGGDGTIATAAGVMAGTPAELAILPGGTLNHFARDHLIPEKLAEAVVTARDGQRFMADVAYVNDRLFLNTSSVGAYVTFVRARERLERRVGYRLASLLAAVRLFFHLHPVQVTLEVDGEIRRYSTPLVFIGVGERESRLPTLGSRIPNGRRALHVLVIRERRAARLIAVALEAATRGVKSVAATPELDSFLVDRCTIQMKRASTYVSLDGELAALSTPLEYRIERDALAIIVP